MALSEFPKLAIPDLKARAFDPERDYPAMVQLLNAVAQADDLERFFTVERLLRNDASSAEFHPRRDRFIIEIGGTMAGAGTVETCLSAQLGRLYFHTFDLLPQWRGKGIGTAALHRCQQLLRALAAEHRDEHPRYFQSYHIPSHQTAAIALLQRHGYQCWRDSLHMLRPNLEAIPDHRPPAGFDIRPLEEIHLRQIWDAKEEAFADAFGFIPSDDAAFEQWKPVNNPTLRRDLSRIAWDGDQVAGMVLIFINEQENLRKGRQQAHTESICIRRPWRKRGVAKTLISACLRAVRAAGMEQAVLTVDAENTSGAVKLYSSMGYEVARRATSYRWAMVSP